MPQYDNLKNSQAERQAPYISRAADRDDVRESLPHAYTVPAGGDDQ